MAKKRELKQLMKTPKWRSQNKKDCPNLLKVVRTYLCSPPSSVPSEQLFGGAGLTYDEKRKLLHADKIDKFCFGKSFAFVKIQILNKRAV